MTIETQYRERFPVNSETYWRELCLSLDYVERMVPFDSKRLQVELRDGTRLLASRSSSEMLRRRAR